VKHYLERVRVSGVLLVSADDRNRLVERHFRPSFAAHDLLPKSAQVLDIGSGGGFPALPLAFARPDCQFTLVESNGRKAAFLSRVSRETGLSNVQVICNRAEQLGAELTGKFDIITARAVSALPTIWSVGSKYMKKQGQLLLWKGREWREEADLAQLGLELREERELSDGGRLLALRIA
jgi:16S rRNA (guanine527-N7)-methyltransferase